MPAQCKLCCHTNQKAQHASDGGSRRRRGGAHGDSRASTNNVEHD